MQQENPQRPYKGLNQDKSYIDSEKDTYRFALNAINNNNFLENESSNEVSVTLPTGFIPIGKVYMELGKTVLFLVNSITNTSEIGIFDEKGNYETHVNDALSTQKLNFNVTHQIQATFRVRRGCDRTVYFTDNLNKPRYFNFDKPQNFKISTNQWDSDKFNLQKTYSKIPNFEKIEVLNSGGSVFSGSYNIAIQYVDESLNSTEWINTSNIIKIYNDQSSLPYKDINGSTNSDIDFLNFGPTNKAIRIEVGNLDEDFIYYRLAIICANNTSGEINKVLYTEVIPISKTFFIYTGTNVTILGSKEQILVFENIIQKAKSIEQVEDKLIIANTQSKQNNLCNLQKYASKIAVDCITKEVDLNSIEDTNNPKNAINDFNGVGYMPGEIYSLGIVYIFDDNTLSPAYHIPGKTPNINTNIIYSPGDKVYAMDNTNNKSNNIVYDGNNQCEDKDYWGLDAEGSSLTGKNIRHHRFPLRSTINKPLVTETLGVNQPNTYYTLALKIAGELFIPYCDKIANPACVPVVKPNFLVRVAYTIDSQDFSFTQNVSPISFANGTTTFTSIVITKTSQLHNTNTFTNINLSITDINGAFQTLIPITIGGTVSTNDDNIYFNNNATYELTQLESTYNVQGRNFKTEILGIKFSNIDIPKSDDGNKIIGYYIVRNARNEFDKTILDSGVLTPCVADTKYIANGLLQPEIDSTVTSVISNKVFGIIHPEHKFYDKQYVNYDKIIQQGNFNVTSRKYGKCGYNDVYNGTSFNSENQHESNDDGGANFGVNGDALDGWSFELITRDNIVSYQVNDDVIINKNNIQNRFYLDALESNPTNDNANEIYNIACDNKIGIIELKPDYINSNINTFKELPYVLLYKENLDVYGNFRVLPYYKEHVNPIYFTTETNNKQAIYNGDSYVCPIKYVNTMYYDNRVAKRAGKEAGFLEYFIGGLLIVAGSVLALTGFGAAVTPFIVGAGIAIIGGGLLLVSSGLKMDAYNAVYGDEYDKGLRKTTLDSWVNDFYNYLFGPRRSAFGWTENNGKDGPSDDTIQWVADCVSDLWFESSVNINLRNKFVTDSTPTFMNAPSIIEDGNNSVIMTRGIRDLDVESKNVSRYPISTLEKHVCKKLLVFDQSRNDNRLYIGVALGEYYGINEDYKRKNKEKVFFHLSLSYDCCSDCLEKFPQRWHWSETSFQEDLIDNYKVFLPNNYKDIDGNTGEIVNIFRLNNDLFMHTKEALWQIPRNYQERVTDQMVSFIGTGSYGEIPAQKIVDDDTGISAGCQHQWSSLKTTYGYFFVSETNKKIYKFSQQGLQAISIEGLSGWFNSNLQLEANNKYYKANLKNYIYNDNPSNEIGLGYIMTYDTKKERIIVSKKDFLIPLDEPCEICTHNDKVIVFRNVISTVNYYKNQGWIYLGLDNCKLKFERTVTKVVNVVKGQSVPNNPEIVTYFNQNVNYVENEYFYITGEEFNIDLFAQDNTSWTMSYNIKANSWTSWHSYLPNFYVHTASNFFSWKHNTITNSLWKHNIKGKYQTYYDTFFPHIVEYVSLSNPLTTRIWNHIKLITEAEKYNESIKEFYDFRFATFNKMVLYNSRQCSGLVNLVVKDTKSNPIDYLNQQIVNTNNNVSIIDKNEKDWLINDFRDIRTIYELPIWNSNFGDIKVAENGYMDKTLNIGTLNENKNWQELESFRDKYLVIRLIFDNFTDIKLKTNYTNENEQESMY